MKRSFILLTCVLALFASCNKGEVVTEAVDENANVQALTVDATLTPATGEGMRTAFAPDDILRVKFVNSAGDQVGRAQVLRGENVSGTSASFTSAKVAVPKDAAELVVFLDNPASNGVNYGSAPTFDHLASQDGTLKDAVAHQVILGTTPATALSSGKASVTLAYKTALLKIVATFPEGATPVAGETTLTVGAAGQYNDIALPAAAPSAASKRGVITVPAASVDPGARTATAYVAVWPESGVFNGASLISKIGGTTYGNPLAVTAIEAGKGVSIAQEVVTIEFKFNISDDEQVIATGVVGNVVAAESVDWISISGGTVTVAANNTGKMRTGSLVLDNGRTYTVTQIGPKEFMGSWTFNTKIFGSGAAAQFASKDPAVIPVTIGEPLKGETLKDADGVEHTNNIGIRGLFYDTVLDACVEFDYENNTAKVGLFLDTRDNAGQKCEKGYVVYFPGLCTRTATAWSSPWAYNTTQQGDPDYCWMWFDVNEDFTEFYYLNRNNNGVEFQTLTQYSSPTMNQICGFGAIVNSENVFNKAIQYSNFFQVNTKGLDKENFVRN
ncbi:MAG: hypothetical protein K6F25_09660 [Bacteroidales bacterium]|nr:hypothetical protein [Bacteroidales bacterium]